MASDFKVSSGNKHSGYRLYLLIVVIILIVALLAAVVVFLCASFRNKDRDFYIVWDGIELMSDNDGISVEATVSPVEFRICGDRRFNKINFSDCSVRVKNYVESGSDYDFEVSVTLMGRTKSCFYSEIDDLTYVFSFDGDYVSVGSDGFFSLDFSFIDAEHVLTKIFGDTAVCDNDVFLGSYYYFCLEVVSPDEAYVVDVPFKIIVPDGYYRGGGSSLGGVDSGSSMRNSSDNYGFGYDDYDIIFT